MKSKMTRQGVFMVWSVILAISALWSVKKDYFPQYKKFQKDFRKATVQLAQSEIESENAKIEVKYRSRIEALDTAMRERTDETRSVNHQQRIAEKEAELKQLQHEDYLKSQELAFAKSLMGTARSKYEHKRNIDPQFVDDRARRDTETERIHYEEAFAQVQALQPGADAAYQEVIVAKADLASLKKGAADLAIEREAIYKELEVWRARVDQINPSDVVRFTANVVRDAPLLDWIDPKYNLKQIVMDGLPDLTGSPKVDRCTSCHLGVADATYDSAELPVVFRAHPKLDLFVGALSPHPVEKFGCTTCHLGRGYGSTFTNAAHTPNNLEQEKEWRKKYGWSDMHYWDAKMLPRRFGEAMCFSCHKPTRGVELTMAEDIHKGRRAFEQRGCYGCHKIDGFTDDLKKRGPSLTRLSAKLDPEWVPRWIAAPRDFYPKTSMPHPFGHKIPSVQTFPDYMREVAHHVQSKEERAAHGKAHETHAEAKPASEADAAREETAAAPEDAGADHDVQSEGAAITDPTHGHFDALHADMVREEAVVIDAITAFLFDRAEELTLDEPPADPGDPAIGRELVRTVSCLGCHKVDDLDEPGQGEAPDLSKIGTKTNRKWIYNWIRDPKKYWPDGKMPNPRLTDVEANHIAAYLSTLKDDAFMQKPAPLPEVLRLEEITVQYKRAKVGEEQAKTEVAAMSEYQRKLYVGEEAVYRYGCFGCHDIKGFEDRGRIGPELTAEGVKEIELFDFGMHKYVPAEMTPRVRHSWIERKILQPKVFFLGKVQNPYEQVLHMPWFGFGDKEAAQVASFVLGQVGKPMPEKYRYDPRGRAAAIAKGRRIVEEKNCTGCHKIGLGWKYVDPSTFDFSKDLVWLRGDLVAKHDPALPEGKFAEVAQMLAPEEKDKVIIGGGGWLEANRLTVFGEDYLSMSDIFGAEPVQVNVGGGDEVRVALDRPQELKVYGPEEGHIGRHYDEAALAPPVLRREGAKVQPEWFFRFLTHVEPVRNHIDPLRMPQWNWTDEEAAAVVEFFSAVADETYPFETEEFAPLGDEHRATVRDVLGVPGTEGFDNSLHCFDCHPAGNLFPTSEKTQWGPNLYLAHERLKKSFVQSWLEDPMAWAPGTRMPNFFHSRDADTVTEVRPNSAQEMLMLAEVLHYLPEMPEIAEALEAEAVKRKNAPPPAEDTEFVEDGESKAGDEEVFEEEGAAKEEEFVEEENPPANPF